MSGKCYECKYCYSNNTLGGLCICVNGNSDNCGNYTGDCCEDECEDCVRWGQYPDNEEA